LEIKRNKKNFFTKKQGQKLKIKKIKIKVKIIKKNDHLINSGRG
jgi:hypothetical protein